MEKLTKKQSEVLTIIKKYIARFGYSPTVRELCEEVGLSSTATAFVHIKHLINKGYLKQTNSKFRTLSLNVPNEYSDKNDSLIDVPLLGKVAAGDPIEAIENPTAFFQLPTHLIPKNKEIFTLEIRGNSMENIGVLDGDIAIIEKNKNAKNGEYIVALTEENEVTLKTFYKEKDKIRLQPENDTMKPIYLNNVTILGKLIGLYRTY